MSTTISPPTDPDDRIEELLDQLVPRPGPPWRRFAVALGLTALVVAGGLSWTMGVLAPNPAATISYSGGRQAAYVAERNAIAVSVYMPNRSRRAVRLTELTLQDAPGVRLVDVGARLRPQPDPEEQDCTTTGGVTACTEAAVAEDFEAWPSSVQALPITVPAGRDVDLFVLLDPTSCQGPDDFPWGHVDATFDFGDGGFPGWSRTIRVQDALAESPQDLNLLDGGGLPAYPPIDGGADAGLGFLAAACALVDDGD